MKLLECDSICGLLVLGITLVVRGEDSSKPRAKRYADKPFPRHNFILGRNVTCGPPSPDDKPGKFISHTWTCKDIRVNNNRIAYGYYPGMGIDSKCNETGGKHEFAQLCRELLKHINNQHDLHALYIPEASCDYTSEPRVLLNKTMPTTDNGEKKREKFTWLDMSAGNGWIITIQCMIKMPGALYG